VNPEKYRNILIIKPSALGDIVHALPVLGALRAAFPEAKLTWLVRKEFAELLECTTGLDEILLFDRKGMGNWFYSPKGFRIFRDFAKKLKAGRYDLVLDLQGLCRSAIFAKMTGCSRRVGMTEARELAHLFYTEQVDRPTDSVHILDTYFAVLKTIGVDNPVPECPLKAPATAQEAIGQKMQQHALTPGEFVVLIPGSAHPYKCWPTERFAQLAERFHQQRDWPAVVVGTQSEQHYAETIKSAVSSPIIDFTGQTRIPELVALIEQAGAIVSNDTGPGHIAAATPTPTVILFGNTNPLRLGPYRRPECIVAIDSDSRGSEIKDTDPNHKIENITVDMTYEKIISLLKQ